MIGKEWAVGPNLFNKIRRDVVNEPESSADNFGLCHGFNN